MLWLLQKGPQQAFSEWNRIVKILPLFHPIFFFNVPWPGISHRAVGVLPSSKGSQCFGGKLFISCTRASQNHSLGSPCDGALAFCHLSGITYFSSGADMFTLYHLFQQTLVLLKEKKKTEAQRGKNIFQQKSLCPAHSGAGGWSEGRCVCLLWNGLSCPSWIRGRQPHL